MQLDSGCSAARLAHHVRDVGVGCSNHLTPTLSPPKLSEGGLFLLFVMERLHVNSSLAKSIGHDPFLSNVPQEVYREMLTFSIGKYFLAFIKDRYEARRVS